MQYVIKTKRLILRPFRESDKKSFIENINNKNLTKWNPPIPHPYTAKTLREWRAKVKKGQGVKHLSLVVEKEKQVIGGVEIRRIEKNHMAELGYWVGEKYWGQGIATEATKATYY